jgi:hypothetical protein
MHSVTGITTKTSYRIYGSVERIGKRITNVIPYDLLSVRRESFQWGIFSYEEKYDDRE